LDALSKRLARLAQLNTPANIPLSYRAYALICVDDPHTVERDIHELIVLIDDSLHARERGRGDAADPGGCAALLKVVEFDHFTISH